MKCPKCRKETNEDDDYCGECGEKLKHTKEHKKISSKFRKKPFFITLGIIVILVILGILLSNRSNVKLNEVTNTKQTQDLVSKTITAQNEITTCPQKDYCNEWQGTGIITSDGHGEVQSRWCYNYKGSLPYCTESKDYNSRVLCDSGYELTIVNTCKSTSTGVNGEI